MAKIFCIPGIIILTIAFLLSLLATISIPTLSWSDIARVTFADGQPGSIEGIDDASGQFRFGIWGYCFQRDSLGEFYCVHTGHGYSVNFVNLLGGEQTIGSDLTRGLPFHAFATAVVGIAWLLSFSEHITVTLIASIVSAFAALLTFIAWILDIVLFARLKSHMSSLGLTEHTNPGTAFWLTFVAWLLLMIAACTVCLGRRRERVPQESTTGYVHGNARRSRFWRRNNNTEKV